MNAVTMTCSPICTRETDFSAGNVVPSLPRRVVSIWRVVGGPAEQPRRGRVPPQHDPVGVDGHEGVGRALQDQPRAGLALEQPARLLRRVTRLALQMLEKARDQRAGEERRPDRQQPAGRRARVVVESQQKAVGDADQQEMDEGDVEREEVERVERDPAVHQGVQGRAPDPVVRERDDHRPHDERRVDLPVLDAVGAGPDQEGDPDRDGAEDEQRRIVHLRRMRQHEREQDEQRARREHERQRPRASAPVEQLYESAHATLTRRLAAR
jgi:hypothetical protein